MQELSGCFCLSRIRMRLRKISGRCATTPTRAMLPLRADARSPLGFGTLLAARPKSSLTHPRSDLEDSSRKRTVLRRSSAPNIIYRTVKYLAAAACSSRDNELELGNHCGSASVKFDRASLPAGLNPSGHNGNRKSLSKIGCARQVLSRINASRQRVDEKPTYF